MPNLVQHPELNRLIRADDWKGLATGTYTRLVQVIKDGSSDKADLLHFFLTEARIIFDIYTQWRRDTLRYLSHRGISDADLESECTHLSNLSNIGRPQLIANREKAWNRIESLAQEAATAEVAQALAVLDEMKDTWRHLHDSEVDFISGLFDVVIRRFGEPALGDMYENWVIGDWFRKRYQRFDVSHFAWQDAFPLIVYLTFESMHGHLAGPGRLGDVTFESFDDRVVFTFAPCGSGGRTVVGEPLDGTPPRMEPPYRFKVLERAHPFAWNLRGVCTYCAHCCVLTEKLPIEHFGYPVRVVDPPLYPNDGHAVCRWTVYRTPEAVPDAVYERLGYRKPQPGTPLGSEMRATRNIRS